MIKRYIRIAAIVLGGFAAAPAAQAQQPALPPLPDEVAAQFPAIGRLGQAGFRTKQGCTATLIAPHIILTAAHCLSPTGTSERVFVAGWSRGDYIDFSQTGLEMRHPAFGMGGRNSPNLDIGFAVLDTPITTVAPIPLAPDGTLSLGNTDVGLIGYHRQTPHILSGDFACPVTFIEVGLFFVGCPVVSGNSGSPILNRTENGDWQVVGVISSRVDGGAIAIALPHWLYGEISARAITP